MRARDESRNRFDRPDRWLFARSGDEGGIETTVELNCCGYCVAVFCGCVLRHTASRGTDVPILITSAVPNVNRP